MHVGAVIQLYWLVGGEVAQEGLEKYNGCMCEITKLFFYGGAMQQVFEFVHL